MKTISTIISDWFYHLSVIDDHNREIFHFTFENLLNNLFTAIVCLLTGLFWNRFLESILFLSTFVFLRQNVGGVHALTRRTCFICTYSMYLTFLWSLSVVDPTFLIIICCIISSLIMKYAPVESSKNILNLRQKNKSRAATRLLIGIYSIIIIVGIVTSATTIYFPISLAIIFVGILLIIQMVISSNRTRLVSINTLRTLATLIISIGIVQAHAPCDWWSYQPQTSDSIRKMIDNM